MRRSICSWVFLFQLVTGSGPDGRIRAQDIESFVPPAAAAAEPVSAAAPPPPPPPQITAVPGAGYVDIPLTSMRQV